MGFFHVGISRVRVRVMSPCDLGYESWSQQLESLAIGENCMMLRSLVLTHYQHVTDAYATHSQVVT